MAVLRNAVYMESFDGHIICIVAGDVDGPLTVRVADIAPMLAALIPGSTPPFRVTGESLQIAGAPGIQWAHAARWKPESPYLVGSSNARIHAVRVLAEAISGIENEESCGPVVAHLTGAPSAVPLHAVASRVLTGFKSAREAVRSGAYAEASDMLVALIGLGPGLTPSGDDLLAGLAASLVWQSRRSAFVGEFAQLLLNMVIAVAPSRTNLISARLLWYACQGLLYAPAMELGAALLQGDADADAISTPLKKLSAIGNTTGVDLATGLSLGTLLGLECDQIAYTVGGEEQPKNNS